MLNEEIKQELRETGFEEGTLDQEEVLTLDEQEKLFMEILAEYRKPVSKNDGPSYRVMMNLWLSAHPVFRHEAWDIIQAVKDQRELLTTKFGETQTGSMRIGFKLPYRFYQILKRIDPDLIDNKKKRAKLAMELPEFCVSPQNYMPASYAHNRGDAR